MADEQDKNDPLEMMITKLINLREEAIKARTACGIERRWREDVAAYKGEDSSSAGLNVAEIASENVHKSNADSPVRSTTYVQLTRQKTNAAAARLADMLYPTEDRNFAIQPTPVPELMTAMEDAGDQPYIGPDQQPVPNNDTGQPLTVKELAQDVMRDAKRKSDAMQREIDDALVECHYNSTGRRIILDAAIYGVGIVRGPMVVNCVKKKWIKPAQDAEDVRVLSISEASRPASKRVPPENFWPDPSCGDDIQQGSYCWEMEPMSPRGLRDLARTESYYPDAIRKCLEEGPDNERLDRPVNSTRSEGVYARDNDTRFELWIYTGEVTRGELATAGVDFGADDEEADLLTKMSAVIVICNNRVIKAMINPLDTEDLPYDVFVWERLPDSPYGVGVPYLMRYTQSTINSAWRAMQDNAAVSHAPQIVMKRDSVLPVNGKWEIVGRKFWWASEDIGDVNDAFRVYDIPNHQQELENIISLAMRFLDEETALPQIAQGEQGAAPDTVGGMTILMNSANTVLRRLVKQFDDMITRPHIQRYYDWFMQYSDKEEIKGDFEIDARGSSALLVRDMQQETLVQLLGLSDHPVYGMYIDPDKILHKTLEARHIAASDVLRSKEEIMEIKQKQEQQPEQPQDPRIAAAQIKAQADVKKMEIDTQSEATNQQMRMQEAADNRAAGLHKMALERDLLILKMAHERQMKVEDIKAALAKTAMEGDSKRDLETARVERAQEQAVA